jgi:hypothetical protein
MINSVTKALSRQTAENSTLKELVSQHTKETNSLKEAMKQHLAQVEDSSRT